MVAGVVAGVEPAHHPGSPGTTQPLRCGSLDPHRHHHRLTSGLTPTPLLQASCPAPCALIATAQACIAPVRPTWCQLIGCSRALSLDGSAPAADLETSIPDDGARGKDPGVASRWDVLRRKRTLRYPPLEGRTPQKEKPPLPDLLLKWYDYGCEVAHPPYDDTPPFSRRVVAPQFNPLRPCSSGRGLRGVFLSPPPAQRKDGVGGDSPVPPHPASHRKSEARRRIFRELVHMATEQGATIPLGISTADALQQCLDRAVAMWRFAADQVDSLAPPSQLDPDHPDYDPDATLANLSYDEDPLYEVITNPQGPDVVQPHRYFSMEREARAEIAKLAGMMTQLGIAERVVRVEEAKAALMVAAIRDAALDIGLDHDTVRRLGAALRERVESAQTRQRSRGTVEAHRQVTAAVDSLTSDD